MDLEYVQIECSSWINRNKFSRVVIQFKKDDLPHSAKIVEYLKEHSSTELEIYVTQSSTCCVDLIVTQHVSNIDAIIHVGSVCLSKPELECDEIQKPVLFVFGRPKLTPHEIAGNTRRLEQEIRSIKSERPQSQICILYDTNHIFYATIFDNLIRNSDLSSSVEVANIHCPLSNWSTTQDYLDRLSYADVEQCRRYGYFVLQRHLSEYDCTIYIGNILSIQLTLIGPRDIWKLSFNDGNQLIKDKINVSKALNRRISLVERLKDEDQLKFGIIITNPLPKIDKCIPLMETYAKAKGHTLYFISMIQTADECKTGNFDVCDAFVILNNCCCSTILESIVFNRPILTDLEFKLACGLEAEYGGVLWPSSSSHLVEDDLNIRRKVSEVSLALVHTRKELLERCFQTRFNRWSGMDFYPNGNIDEGDNESLAIEEGLTGIASSYISEPLKRNKPNNLE